MKKKITILFLFLLAGFNIVIKSQEKKVSLECPYYTYSRTGNQHIDLSANWQLGSKEQPIAILSELENIEWINVACPTSVQMAYFKADKLGDPYKNLNALEHEKLENKIWYYKKDFTLPIESQGNNIILNFDGIDYFAKVWLNGIYIGNHEGIFGGPIIDISKKVNYGKANSLIVEVISANYGKPNFNPNIPQNIIKGWFLTGGSAMEPYFNLGMWRNVRIEILPHYHIERPFLFTKKIEGKDATLGFTMEIFSGKNSLDYKLHPWNNTQISNYSNPKDAPLNKKIEDKLTILLEFIDSEDVVYRKEFTPYVIEGRCFLEEEFNLNNPKLWYPNGLGLQHTYRVRISLFVNEQSVDKIEFDFGIRTIEQIRTAGVRTGDRWQNWQFVVNGKKFFIKGINWMPVDALYDLTAEKYDWAVKMAKNAGIQMFRIWGSGLLENEEFYNACDKYGILVWQDFNIANFDTPEWPQDVWEAQVCQNIFRLRNRTSLAVWCGGNEFNPYSYGNAATIGILERNIAIFDPTRFFVRTSPDEGSLHTYPDFDPVWYKKFELIPYVAETGVHCITDPINIREVVKSEELKDLSGMYDEEFAAIHPEFVMHFAEYNPHRVPRMLSRASHIDDMSKPTIEAIAEASQIGAGEFYQIMSESFQSNYPITAGLMPWVYKRSWPVVAAINLVDGFGQPSATYYFLKRTYDPIRILLDIKRILWAPGETFPIVAKVLNGVDQPKYKGRIVAEIMDHNFNKLSVKESTVNIIKGTSVTSCELGEFTIPEYYKENVFFVLISLYDEARELISQADYWPRTIKQMEDKSFYDKYNSEPTEWPTLNSGPWIKPTVANSKTTLVVSDLSVEPVDTKNGTLTFSVKNIGNKPSFMTNLDIQGAKRVFFASDNYFWLQPNESKTIHIEYQLRDTPAVKSFYLTVDSWNAKTIKKKVTI